jgi:hypothetical protein
VSAPKWRVPALSLRWGRGLDGQTWRVFLLKGTIMKSARRMMYGVVMILAILAIAGTVVACEVRTPGYWKNHPDDPAWALFSLTFGGVTYTVDNAIPVMKTPVKGDKTYNLFDAVVAVYLNYLNGAPFESVTDSLINALAWLDAHPPGSGVAASSAAWKQAEPWFYELDAFNNGLRGVPAAD